MGVVQVESLVTARAMYKDHPIQRPWKTNVAIGVVLLTALGFLFTFEAPRRIIKDVEDRFNKTILVSAPSQAPFAEGRTKVIDGFGGHYDEQEDEIAETHYKCYQSAEFAEICVYDLLCFDGDKVRWGFAVAAAAHHTTSHCVCALLVCRR